MQLNLISQKLHGISMTKSKERFIRVQSLSEIKSYHQRLYLLIVEFVLLFRGIA